MSTQEKEQEAIEWRRSQVISLRAKGYNQTTIAKKVGFSEPTISKDIAWINEQAQNNLKTHLETRLIIETEKIISGLEEILLDTWKDLDNNERTLSLRDKLSCRSLLKELYQTKLNILTSAPVIQRGLNYVQMYKDKLEQLKHDREQSQQQGEGQDNNKIDSNSVLVTEDEEEEEELTEDAENGSSVRIQEPKPKTLLERKKPEPIYE